VIFGQVLALFGVELEKSSRPGSVSGLNSPSTGTIPARHAAIDAFVRVNDDILGALVESVHGANRHAVHELQRIQLSLTMDVIRLRAKNMTVCAAQRPNARKDLPFSGPEVAGFCAQWSRSSQAVERSPLLLVGRPAARSRSPVVGSRSRGGATGGQILAQQTRGVRIGPRRSEKPVTLRIATRAVERHRDDMRRSPAC